MPILMLKTDSAQSRKDDAKAVGAIGSIVKPVGPDVLGIWFGIVGPPGAVTVARPKPNHPADHTALPDFSKSVRWTNYVLYYRFAAFATSRACFAAFKMGRCSSDLVAIAK